MPSEFVEHHKKVVNFRLSCLFRNARLFKIEKFSNLSLHPVTLDDLEVWLKFGSYKRFYSVRKGSLTEEMRSLARREVKKIEKEIFGYCQRWGTRAYICLNFLHYHWGEKRLFGAKCYEWLDTLAHEIAHVFVPFHKEPFPTLKNEILKFMLLKGREKKHLGRKRSFFIGFEVDFYDEAFFKELFEGLNWKAYPYQDKGITFLTAKGWLKELDSFLKKLESIKGIDICPSSGNNFLLVPRSWREKTDEQDKN